MNGENSQQNEQFQIIPVRVIKWIDGGDQPEVDSHRKEEPYRKAPAKGFDF